MITPQQLKAMKENYIKNCNQIILEQNISKVLNKLEELTKENIFEVYVINSYNLSENYIEINFGGDEYKRIKQELKNRGWTIIGKIKDDDPNDKWFIVTA